MAFVNSQQTRLLVGPLAAAAIVKTVAPELAKRMLDTTSLVDTAAQFIPGLESSGFTIGAMFDNDTAAGGYRRTLSDLYVNGSQRALSYAPAGFAASNGVFLADTFQAGYRPTSGVDDLVMLGLEFATTGRSLWGVSLDDVTAITADGNGTARDNSAATSNGGIAHIHATAFSGLTSNVVTIEHSVDGSTSWATLVTFATITAATSERVVVAAGTTVRRYLRVVDNVTGTGSCTRQVSFARA